MVEGMLALLACQLAGEALARLAGLPLPGPVLGMGLLLAALAWRGRDVPAPLAAVADGLLGNLPLLFVPAAVGIVQYADLLAGHALGIGVSIAVSTCAAVAAAGLAFKLAQRR